MASKPWKQVNNGNRSSDQRSEEEEEQDIDQEPINPLAIVPSTSADPAPLAHHEPAAPVARGGDQEVVSAQRVRKEEVESKISAWETEELAKIDSRFRRQEAIISGWEAEQIEQASAWLKKIERKIEEKRARAVERVQNDVAVARQKAEEKRASVEARRGEKVAKVLELAKLMQIVGRAPAKRSFFRPYKHAWA